MKFTSFSVHKFQSSSVHEYQSLKSLLSSDSLFSLKLITILKRSAVHHNDQKKSDIVDHTSHISKILLH